MSSVSPTKDQLRSEMQALKLQVRSIECEAKAHHEHQRAMFRMAAEAYASEARDINRAEIAQTEVMAASFYDSNMKLLESAANAELGAQRSNLIAEAESAMMAMRERTVLATAARLPHLGDVEGELVAHVKYTVLLMPNGNVKITGVGSPPSRNVS